MGRLPRNWLLLFGNLDEEEKDTLVELAEFGPAFLGNISRIGCFAEGYGYVDGEEAWSVDYDYESRKPADALRVDGPLPPELAAIIEQARAAEAKGQGSDIGIDLFFEIPGKMSKALCGFNPHEEPPSGFRWSMLQRIGGEPAPKSRPKGFLARLFGGR